MRVCMLFCECVVVYCIWRKVTLQYFSRASADILALPKNPQWSSPIQQPCPNKLCTSRLFSLFLSASLPLSYPSSCFSFDCHPLVKPDHTMELNHIWQFKLVLFSLSLVLRSISEQSGLSASAAPRLFCSHLSMCIWMSLFPNPTLSITRRTKKMKYSNDRATLIWFSKDIITEFQHCTVCGN